LPEEADPPAKPEEAESVELGRILEFTAEEPLTEL